MISRKSIEEFVATKRIAVVGVSKNKAKFGNIVYNELKKKNYSVFAVNKMLDEIEGEKCYKNLDELKTRIDAVVCVVPPKQTEQIVKEANAIEIKHIWMQQGSESNSAIEYCKQHGINVIYKECLLMFLEPVKSIHRFHKWLWKILGKLPK